MARLIGFLVMCFCVFEAVDALANDFNKRQERTVKEILHLYKTNSTFAKLFDQWEREKKEFERKSNKFPCKPLPPSTEVPTSVHKLRPADVKVIGAVGDSLTAGRGAALGVVGLLIDFYELSWSIGGVGSFKDMVTLPNIIREYNPDVIGASVSPYESVLNEAVSGAKSDGLLNQTITLVNEIKADSRIDFESDWKVVTVFIGGNDLCAICYDYDYYNPDNYIKRVQEGLDYLLENLPRTFINLVEVLNVEMVQELNNNILCSAVHIYACDCAAFPKSKEEEAKIIEYREDYQEKLRELVKLERYHAKDDFEVVLQPFYRDTYPPYKAEGVLDLTYFASDCFHYSTKGQQAAAKALWNNMVEPVGSKRLDWHPDEELEKIPSSTQPRTVKNVGSFSSMLPLSTMSIIRPINLSYQK
ncbi:phospholipase b1, membrane-associated [Plakobranchus ocellatus]|uniref:Phospholipase B1, membrane-associated n=1 Tax=Plakobranchus ocellatus TaxID=259542 RepID=A0AAV4AUT1_9GAST|nr:phospholipase b1, membrane-associated [Plakobranchus ocellatus]